MSAKRKRRRRKAPAKASAPRRPKIPARVEFAGLLALEPGGVAVIDGEALDDLIAARLGAALSPLRLPLAQTFGNYRVTVERLPAADE